MKGAAVLFSKKSDEWETPDSLFQELSREFHFTLDAAATMINRKCLAYYGPDCPVAAQRDALAIDWHAGEGAIWLNPPYSMVTRFVAHAAKQAARGETIVLLLPARTDTRWFHQYIYNKPGVEVRFLKGRLKFEGASSSAPFPSMVVVMHGRKGWVA